MEETLKFLIQLGELFEKAEQEVNFEREQAIYIVAKNFLEKNNITIEEIEKAIDNELYRTKFDEIDAIVLLLTYMKWKNKTIK